MYALILFSCWIVGVLPAVLPALVFSAWICRGATQTGLLFCLAGSAIYCFSFFCILFSDALPFEGFSSLSLFYNIITFCFFVACLDLFDGRPDLAGKIVSEARLFLVLSLVWAFFSYSFLPSKTFSVLYGVYPSVLRESILGDQLRLIGDPTWIPAFGLVSRPAFITPYSPQSALIVISSVYVLRKNFGFFAFLLAMISVPLLFQSRVAALMAAVFLLVYFSEYMRLSKSLFVFFALGLFLLVILLFGGDIYSLMTDFRAGSLSSRVGVLAEVWSYFSNSPFWGYSAKPNSEYYAIPVGSHSWLLSILIEGGFCLLALYFLIFIKFFKKIGGDIGILTLLGILFLFVEVDSVFATSFYLSLLLLVGSKGGNQRYRV